MDFQLPKDVVQFEWGYWPETIRRWQDEGMCGDEPWEALGITHYFRADVQVRILPAFEHEIIEDEDETVIERTTEGVVQRRSKLGTRMPQFIEFPVKGLDDFERLKDRLDPTTPGRYPDDWASRVEDYRSRRHVLVMGRTEISFFGFLRALIGVENLLLAYYDQPELIHAMCRHHLDFLKRVYERALCDVDYDFAFMWEDMSFKNGPLISPALVREFMLPYYREMTAFIRDHGMRHITVDSDGDVSLLIRPFMEGGVNGMLPFEVAAGMDVRRIREDYPDLVIFGGIDKREIAKGRRAIDRELEAKLPTMFRSRGYIPSLDHHVPPEVSYDDFRYYLEKTREIYRRVRG